MVLRWLIGNWAREQARRKVSEAVKHAASEAAENVRHAPEEAAEQPAESADEPIACDVGFVFALRPEAGGLVDGMSDAVTTRGQHFTEHLGRLADRTVAVIESGAGREAAARATADLIAVRRPQWVVSTGFAGSLGEDLKRGHILMADQVVDARGQEFSVGLKMDAAALSATPGVHVGRLLTVDRLVRKPSEKRALGERYAAAACDMETIGVAETCRASKVRFLSIRIISDAVDEELPAYLDHLIEQKTISGKLGAATGAIFRRPSSVKEMWRMKEDALKASDRLAKFLLGVLPQLGSAE